MWLLKWGLWLGATLGSFGWIEYQAIQVRDEMKKKGERTGTLTATLRYWLGIDPNHWRRWILAPVFGAFCFYLFTHILFGWFMF